MTSPYYGCNLLKDWEDAEGREQFLGLLRSYGGEIAERLWQLEAISAALEAIWGYPKLFFRFTNRAIGWRSGDAPRAIDYSLVIGAFGDCYRLSSAIA